MPSPEIQADMSPSNDETSFDELLEQFITQDELQWFAEHPYELMPSSTLAHEPRKRMRQKGHKRVSWRDQLASVKDKDLHAKLFAMVQTRAAKRAKHGIPNLADAKPSNVPSMLTQDEVPLQAPVQLPVEDVPTVPVQDAIAAA